MSGMPHSDRLSPAHVFCPLSYPIAVASNHSDTGHGHIPGACHICGKCVWLAQRNVLLVHSDFEMRGCCLRAVVHEQQATLIRIAEHPSALVWSADRPDLAHLIVRRFVLTLTALLLLFLPLCPQELMHDSRFFLLV